MQVIHDLENRDELEMEIPDEEEEDNGFIMDRELDSSSNSSSRSSNTRQAIQGSNSSLAQGRIDPGHVTYDDVRQEYLRMDPSDIRDRHRPPGEWSATNREMTTVINWTNDRISAQDRMREDNTLKFIETYAAERSKERDRLQKGTASRPGAFRREEESNFRRTQDGSQILERPSGIAEDIGGEPSPPTFGQPSVPSVLGGGGGPPRPGETQESADQRARQEEQLEEIERGQTYQRARMNERERLTRISGWLERPEIIGIQGYSSELYGSVESAFVHLKENFPQFADLDDINTIPSTNEIVVRNLFARLAANMAGHSDFLNLPVTSLDRTGDRFRHKINEILKGLDHWGYNHKTKSFERRSYETMQRSYDSKLALPGRFSMMTRMGGGGGRSDLQRLYTSW